jgi:hypothetical protein
LLRVFCGAQPRAAEPTAVGAWRRPQSDQAEVPPAMAATAPRLSALGSTPCRAPAWTPAAPPAARRGAADRPARAASGRAEYPDQRASRQLQQVDIAQQLPSRPPCPPRSPRRQHRRRPRPAGSPRRVGATSRAAHARAAGPVETVRMVGGRSRFSRPRTWLSRGIGHRLGEDGPGHHFVEAVRLLE